jgi:hypothetical protein
LRRQGGVTLRYWNIPLLCFHEKRLYADCILPASLAKSGVAVEKGTKAVISVNVSA